MAKMLDKQSKPIQGTLRKRIMCIPEEVRCISVAPAINVVELLFTADGGNVLIVNSWRFKTKQQAMGYYEGLAV